MIHAERRSGLAKAVRPGILLAGIIGFSVCCSAEDNTGLVAHYTFEEGPGQMVKDWSGNGNHGTTIDDVTYVKLGKGKGYALRFNTGKAHVDCGNKPSLDLRKEATIECWFRPESAWMTKGAAGIVGRGMAGQSFGYGLSNCIGNCLPHLPGGTWRMTRPLDVNAWHHLVCTFIGAEARLYLNGNLACVARSLGGDETPAGGNFYLRYPATWGTPTPDYKCSLDDVRVYDRAMTEAEARGRYGDAVRATGHHDPARLDRVKLTPLPFPQSDTLAVQADVSRMVLPTDGAVVKLDLRNAAGKTVIEKTIVPAALGSAERGAAIRLEFEDLAHLGTGYATLGLGRLPPGRYSLRATATGGNGQAIGVPSSIAIRLPLERPDWIKPYRNTKILNNLVAELLNVQATQVGPQKEYTFTNPRNGWVLIVSKAATPGAARVRVFVDDRKDPVIVHDGRGGAHEAMRRLSAGPHTLRVQCDRAARATSLIVRAIPELMVMTALRKSGLPLLKCFGHYNMAYLERIGLLDCLNSIIQEDPVTENEPYLREWRRQGKRLLYHGSQGEFRKNYATSPEQVFDAWTVEKGLKEDGYDGVMQDEFSGMGHDGIGTYLYYAEAIRRLGNDPRFRDRVFFPWCMPMYHSEAAIEMLKAIGGVGYKWAEEKYLVEQATEESARAYMDHRLRENLLHYEALIPGSARHMIIALGFLSAPPETLNRNPAADFKVYMDMQMHLLATDPVFFGLCGIQWYHNAYADEEYVRWAAKLFRHYGLEGRTNRLTQDPYLSTHVQNPDFDRGTTGWTLQPAEEGAIDVGQSEGYGILQTRCRGGDMAAAGDHFLVTRRSAKGPNRFTQKIRGLTPGRLYSVKEFTADYDELLQGKSTQTPHGVEILVDGAEMLPDRTFHQMFHSGWVGKTYGPFNKGNSLYVTYHRVIFRATVSEAQLIVSDWKGDTNPGGPIGRRLMHNFVEIQPYLED